MYRESTKIRKYSRFIIYICVCICSLTCAHTHTYMHLIPLSNPHFNCRYWESSVWTPKVSHVSRQEAKNFLRERPTLKVHGDKQNKKSHYVYKYELHKFICSSVNLSPLSPRSKFFLKKNIYRSLALISDGRY